MSDPSLLAEAGVAERYRQVRAATVRLCDTLSAEDCTVQSMPDASPTKWELFNSYYNGVGGSLPAT